MTERFDTAGTGAQARDVTAPAADSLSTPLAGVTEAMQAARLAGSRSGLGGDRRERKHVAAEVEAAARAGSGALGRSPGEAAAGPLAAQVDGAPGAEVAARLAQILEVRDASGATRPDHVVLRLDNGLGGEDRIRVGLRGELIQATIDAASHGDAERLRSGISELRRALERQGLEADGLNVRAALSSSRELMELPRTAAFDVPRTLLRQQDGSGSAPGGDPWTRNGQDKPGRDAGESQSRSRREQKGGSPS